MFGNDRKQTNTHAYNGTQDFFKYGQEAKKFVHEDIVGHTKLLKKLGINEEI